MALLPLMCPIACDTAYFGGIEITIYTWVWHKVSLLHLGEVFRRLALPPHFVRARGATGYKQRA